MPANILPTLISIFAVSAISVTGILVFSLHRTLIEHWLIHFVSLSAGTLLATVFLHMIPEMAEGSDFRQALLLVLAGISGSFVIEKVIHWRHCHDLECHENIHPVGTINIMGDAAHNFIDGMLIAGAFLVSTEIGIATTIAVAVHEIPQEIGDFAVLIYSGYTKRRALLMNMLAACTAFVGAFVVFAASGSVENIEYFLLPLAAGNFLYIAGVDLMPELHKETRIRHGIAQFSFLLLGMAIMVFLTSALNPHEYMEEAQDEQLLEDGTE
jgi:zinc and cadmium transporter